MRHTARSIVLLIGLTACFATVSCDRRPGGAAKNPTAHRKIASLVPAATDMLLGMGAGDHLVAVSNFETASEVKTLPRVGDYERTDWETLARLRPDAMIVQIAPDRLPPGLKARADELGIEVVNVRIERLEDVFDNIQRLGAIASELDKGREATRKMRERLDAVRERCAGRPPVSTLLVRDENGREVIGPDTFLDDLLKVVNATNAAAGLANRYPSIDREKLLSLRPQAVVVLLPGAKPATLEASARTWAAMTDVPAARDRRVYTLTAPYALLPGPRLADLAEQLADALHPDTTTRPSATTSPGTQPTPAAAPK
jgi:ABC-type hemin transport system substrate-binding protein